MAMKIFKRTLLLLTALSLSMPAAAAQPAEAPDAVKTTLLSQTSAPLTRSEMTELMSSVQSRGQDKAIVIPAALIVLAGAKVWSVITNNRPSADLGSAYASAVPGFAYNWDELSSWQKVTRKYRFTVDHWLQGRAVDITYELSYYYGSITMPGGDLRKGHYLANFVIKPERIDLKWGWQVGLDVAMSHPMNVGTGEEPVAMLNADLKWQYAKVLSTTPEIGMNTVSLDGYGNLNENIYGELSITPIPDGSGLSREGGPQVKWN